MICVRNWLGGSEIWIELLYVIVHWVERHIMVGLHSPYFKIIKSLIDWVVRTIILQIVLLWEK